MITSIQLSDPARGMTSVLKPREGIAWQGHEFTPAVRASAESKPGEDGSNDSTAFLDAGAVTLTLAFYTGSRALMDEVAAYLVPWARPYLIVTDDGWLSPRQVQLRTEAYAHPIERGRGLNREVQYSWVAPRGVWEDTAAQTWLIPANSPDVLGVTSYAETPGGWTSGHRQGFESGQGGWTNTGNATIAVSTAQARTGTHSLALTSAAAGDFACADTLAGSITTLGFPVTAGQVVPVSVWARAAVTGRTVQAGVGFYDGAGTFISSSYDPASQVTTTTSGWVQSSGTRTAPAGAVMARMIVQALAAAAAGEVQYLDDAQMGPAPALDGGIKVTTSGVRAMAAAAPGVSTIFVYGNARPRWRARIYGPATGPKLARDDIGAAFEFGDTLILASGEYVELDRAAKTALFMSEPDASRLGMVDWTVSEWFPLDPAGPGNWPNLLRYHATSGTDSSSYVELTCWPVWMP